MSSDFSVFMRGEPGSSLASLLEKMLGCSFHVPEVDCGDALHAELMEVAITYDESHDLLDDNGIPFESYPVSMEFARSAAQSQAELRHALCRDLALLCGRLLAERGHADTMVVRDAQELIEHHERRGPTASGVPE